MTNQMSEIDFSDSTGKCSSCENTIKEFWEDLREELKNILPEKCLIEVNITDGETIKDLNSTYRGKDYVTDVLSFEDGDTLPDGRVFLGSIIICLEKTEKQAKEIGNSFDEELRFLFMHGVLHLLGYDHETDEGEMFELQKSLKQNLSSYFQSEGVNG